MDVRRGLRERKKEQTRQAIREAALRLFSERGFHGVTIAEIADQANVSVATVFNYFPTTEDLVYSGMEAFEDELLRAIRERPAGEPILTAFAHFVLVPRGLLESTDQGARQALAAVTRMIIGSPALRAREQQVLERCTHSLAELIAEETGAVPSDVRPWVIANALIGVHRALLDYVRREVLAGRDHRLIARGVRTEGKRAVALLEKGLARAPLDG
jgi:AcrR family transcriptional regulator